MAASRPMKGSRPFLHPLSYLSWRLVLMKRLLFLTCVLVLAPAWAIAAFDDAKDKPKADSPETAAEQLKALAADFNKTRTEIVAKYRATQDEAEKEKILEQYYAVPQTFVGRYAEFAEKHAKDPAALQALVWLVTNGGGAPEAGKAADTLVKDHLDKPAIATLIQQGSQTSGPGPGLEKIARGVIEKSTDDQKKALATVALAKVLGNQAELIHSLKKASGEALKKEEATHGKEFIARLRAADPDKVCKEAEGLLEQVIEKHGDIKQGNSTLGATAKNDLFMLRTFSIGKVAPEIDGEDTDGKPMKLSDYRGKVVVIDFWGHW
jgi:hypothetical protein